MNRLSVAIRFLPVLMGLAASTFLAMDSAGLWNRGAPPKVDERQALSELVALHTCLAVSNGDVQSLSEPLTRLMNEHTTLRQVTVASVDGAAVLRVGPVKNAGSSEGADPPHTVEVRLPITMQQRTWGEIQIAFAQAQSSTASGTASRLGMLLMALCSLPIVVIDLWKRWRSRGKGDSSQRVMTMLDTMAEAVMVLDAEGFIVFVNGAFTELVGETREALAKRAAGLLRWVEPRDDAPPKSLPWNEAIAENIAIVGRNIELIAAFERRHSLIAHCAPLTDDDGANRGVLVSLSDITLVQLKTAELEAHLEMLREARAEIEHINQQLEHQATHDAMTGCLNRRAYLSQFDRILSAAQRHDHELACIMLDVDHFKSINDNHGHSTGDEVLRTVSHIVLRNAREEDLVCRWGGEEFCVLLPFTNRDQATQAAERFREAIAADLIGGVKVTASFGVSSLSFGADNAQRLIDQADKALYASKHGGRNRVTIWHTSMGPSADAA